MTKLTCRCEDRSARCGRDNSVGPLETVPRAGPPRRG
jgi:hypothetical protein